MFYKHLKTKKKQKELKMYDVEDLEDWAKQLLKEGDRHFERNLEEAGYTPEDIYIICKEVNEFIMWDDDDDDDDIDDYIILED